MTQPRIIDGTPGFRALVGHTVGTSNWREVDQQTIDVFGTATGDEQWIHMDPVRAADGPFGGTIAHGFLILSLLPVLANQTFTTTGFSARVNYGIEKVRFPRPLQAGSRVRDTVSIADVEEVAAGLRVTFVHEVTTEDGDKPVCVASTVTLFTTA